MNNKKIMLLPIIAIIISILGATFAYWRWASTNNQATNVTFTVGSNFSCSANGGGNITNTTYFAPSTCTNSTYAIQRTITTSITNSGSDTVYLDMWLNVNSIGSGLSGTTNFKYALTTSNNSCTTNVLTSGNFYGKQANDQIQLLDKVTSGSTYYLYIWLDAAETNSSTYNQNVSLSLGGECTNHSPYVYTSNIYDVNATGYNSVWLGQSIPSVITTYSNPTAAITALEAAYSTAHSGVTASLPFFLRHTIGDGTLWCADEYNNGVATGNSACAFPSQSACTTAVPEWEHDNITYSCVQNDFTNSVAESYVGFTVTSAMATANPGMVAGTYYLRGGDNGAAFLTNAKKIYDAFGGINCYSDGTQITGAYNANYNPNPSSDFSCDVSGLGVHAYSDGGVNANDGAGSDCRVECGGILGCYIPVGDGGGIVDPDGPK